MVNYPAAEVGFTRIVEYKHLLHQVLPLLLSFSTIFTTVLIRGFTRIVEFEHFLNQVMYYLIY